MLLVPFKQQKHHQRPGETAPQVKVPAGVQQPDTWKPQSGENWFLQGVFWLLHAYSGTLADVHVQTHELINLKNNFKNTTRKHKVETLTKL